MAQLGGQADLSDPVWRSWSGRAGSAVGHQQHHCLLQRAISLLCMTCPACKARATSEAGPADLEKHDGHSALARQRRPKAAIWRGLHPRQAPHGVHKAARPGPGRMPVPWEGAEAAP